MKLVILDRDGVINRDSDAYIRSPDQWIPLPGSIEAIARLSRAGYQVVVATNQSGLGRGYFTPEALDAMHLKLKNLVQSAGGEVSGIYYCPHAPEESCGCRKPLPGLLDQIRDALALETLEGVPLVGDGLRDLQAGFARQCQPVLVRSGKGRITERDLRDYPELGHTLIFDDLGAFVDYWLGEAEA